MACDGIYDVKSSKDCIDSILLQAYKNEFTREISEERLKESLTILTDSCLSKEPKDKGTDNMSSIVIHFK